MDTPPNWPTRLDTPRLILRLFEPTDAPAYHEVLHASRDHLVAALGWGPERFGDLAWVDVQLHTHRENHAARRNLPLGIFTRDGQFVGAVGLVRPDWEAGRSEVGIWMGARALRQGYAAEATLGLLRHAFEAMGMQRIDVFTDPDNAAVRAGAERYGFSFDGLQEVDPPVPGHSPHTAAYHLDRSGFTALTRTG